MDHVFRLWYASMIHSFMYALEYTQRSQALLATALWMQYGNEVLSETYLQLAEKSQELDALNDIRATVLMRARKLRYQKETSGRLSEYKHTKVCTSEQKELESAVFWCYDKPSTNDALSTEHGSKDTGDQSSESFFDLVRQYTVENEFDKALEQLKRLEYITNRGDYVTHCKRLVYAAAIYLRLHQFERAKHALIAALENAKQSSFVLVYYWATIKLAGIFTRSQKKRNLRQAKNSLERIFSKVVLTQDRTLIAEVNLAYAKVLFALTMAKERPLKKSRLTFDTAHFWSKSQKAAAFSKKILDAMEKVNESTQTKEQLKELRKSIRAKEVADDDVHEDFVLLFTVFVR
ncbi:hypothetical protein BDF20DRAFT_517641 [Mycotypha africana]|uniref:uncharacterized protein n=1 Tax=Mycotypha africana TaxID=64632 RepID=UPI002300C72D|nr:uncharacterized protein BDF20DRAFT_517641 [Mycotypha africana]KAI8979573.1 hypothetical protein BDF20DRAFT_517641 [Mycotypha africana]